MPPETFLRGLELYPGFLSFFLFSSAFLEVCHGAACDNMYMWRGEKKTLSVRNTSYRNIFTPGGKINK